MKAAIILNQEFSRAVVEDKIICADGGYVIALKKGLTPLFAVGDFDSSNLPEDVSVYAVPAEKDFTDGEFALQCAVKHGFDDIAIYGAYGGRPDHVFYNFHLLAIAKSLGCKAVIKGDGFDVYLAEKRFLLKTDRGDLVSVVPFGDEAHIMSSEGLEYEINDLVLDKYQTKGISNIATDKEITLEIKRGSCLVFHIFRKEV